MNRTPFVLALGLLAACHSTAGSAIRKEAPATAAATERDAAPEIAARSASAVEVDAARTPALGAIASGNNALGLDIYAVARKGRSANLAISPLSISMALTMTWAGAGGETAAQMKSVLHADGSPESALAAEANALAWARDQSETVTLKIANRLFGENTYSFDAGYLERTNAAFGAALMPVDFKGAPDAAREAINGWVAAQTEKHIENLLPAGSVTSATRLVLADAVYFLGRWERPFKLEETQPGGFHLSGARTVEVPIMHELGQSSFARADGVKVLDRVYAGRKIAMAFVLPDAIGDGALEAVEARLSPATLAAWLGAMAPARVRVALPKFTIEPAQPLAIRPILASLGMPLAFDRTRADFTGMSAAAGDRLFLSDIFHEAFVKVDEQGTEAAAATGATVRRALVQRREAPPEEFVADHPFLFVLRDVESGAILFVGRVAEPGGSAKR